MKKKKRYNHYYFVMGTLTPTCYYWNMRKSSGLLNHMDNFICLIMIILDIILLIRAIINVKNGR